MRKRLLGALLAAATLTPLIGGVAQAESSMPSAPPAAPVATHDTSSEPPLKAAEVDTDPETLAPVWQRDAVRASTLQGQGYDGSGTTIVVIDSGIIDNPVSNFGSRLIWEACFDRVTSACNGATVSSGPGTAAPDPLKRPGYDHGTSVADLAVGQTNGIAPGANVIMLKTTYYDAASNSNRSATLDVRDALNYTRDTLVPWAQGQGKPIVAVNMSVSGNGPITNPCTTSSIYQPVLDLYGAGVISFIASGNDGFNNGVGVPGCVDVAMTVSGTSGGATNSVQMHYIANQGGLVDVAAPFVSLAYDDETGATNTFGGTSGATPIAAGVFLLLSDARPASPAFMRADSEKWYGETTTPSAGCCPSAFVRQEVDAVDALAHLDNAIAATPSTGGVVTETPVRAYSDSQGINKTDTSPHPAGTTLIDLASVLGTTNFSGVTANVTVHGSTADGYATLWAAGQPQPVTSNVNFKAGETAANEAVLPVSSTGQLALFTTVPVNVIIDLQGWHRPNGGVQFVQPTRIRDTRPGGVQPFAAFGQQVGGLAGVPNNTCLESVLVNMTVIQPSASAGYAAAAGLSTPWPNGTSNQNWNSAGVVRNILLWLKPDSGWIAVYNGSSGVTNFALDALGYTYNSSCDGNSNVKPLAPSRVLDTRNGTGGTTGPIAANQSFDLTARGVAGVPSNAKGVLLSLTVANPSGAGDMSAFPQGEPWPGVSNVNFITNDVRSNLVMVPVNPANGKVTIYNRGATNQVIGDVVGYVAA